MSRNVRGLFAFFRWPPPQPRTALCDCWWQPWPGIGDRRRSCKLDSESEAGDWGSSAALMDCSLDPAENGVDIVIMQMDVDSLMTQRKRGVWKDPNVQMIHWAKNTQTFAVLEEAQELSPENAVHKTPQTEPVRRGKAHAPRRQEVGQAPPCESSKTAMRSRCR